MKKYKLDMGQDKGKGGIDYEAELNPQQRAVVKAKPGPALVIAGAGSGKTHTLTYRVGYLLDLGVHPERILLLTFTNKAARSMTERVAGLVQVDVRRLWSGTFHSIGNRVLRQHANRLGYPTEYTILDSEDAGTLMKTCLAERGDDHLERRFPRGNVLSKIYSYCLNTQRKVDEVLQERYPYFAELGEPIREVFQIYQSRKLEMGLMDFDDLLLNWKRLLVECDDVRENLTDRFEHVLVDEYQDTNHIQGELVDLMSAKHGNIMVVGDDCQSIYRFRGAEYKNILEFPQRYPGCQEFRLEINYRSTPQILELANQSIAKNEGQFQKTLRSERPDGPEPALVQIKDVYQQAAFVCQRTLELADEGVPLNEIAVLYRAHHHSMELQVEMTRRGIPYVVRSGVRFFEQAHIKDVLSYLRFMYNPKDELSFMRFAQHYQGIGTKRARDLWQEVRASEDPLATAASEKLMKSLPKRAQHGWKRGSELLDELRKRRLTHTPADLIDTVSRSGYRDYMERSFENFENREGDLEQLANYAGQYEDLDRFLGELTLMSSVSGQDIVVGGDQPDEFVCLSSIHQAKGLEWTGVFVLWLSDGHFPSANAAKDDDGLEEERRLFYVATTRARDELYLCHPFTHQGRDRRVTMLRESPFIEELRVGDNEREPWEEWVIDAG